MSEQQRDLTPQPNKILATPDTVAQCRTELRTRDEATAARADAAAQRGAIVPGRSL